jgi:hypothetical protein
MTALKRCLSAAALALPLLAASPAQAYWHGGWGVHVGGGWGGGYRPGWGYHPGWGYGWHPGWGYGWRGGVYVGIPPVAPYPYGYAYPYRPYRWIPGYYGPGGYYIAPHWGY